MTFSSSLGSLYRGAWGFQGHFLELPADGLTWQSVHPGKGPLGCGAKGWTAGRAQLLWGTCLSRRAPPEELCGSHPALHSLVSTPRSSIYQVLGVPAQLWREEGETLLLM